MNNRAQQGTSVIVDTEQRRRNIAAIYKATYFGSDGSWHGRADAGTIYEQLVALGDNPSLEAIREISRNDIGPGWLRCNLCGKGTLDGDMLTQVMELRHEAEGGDDGPYFDLCFQCLQRLGQQVLAHLNNMHKQTYGKDAPEIQCHVGMRLA